MGFLKKLFFSLTCSQIWLSPFKEDCLFTYLMKWKKNPYQKLRPYKLLAHRSYVYIVWSKEEIRYNIDCKVHSKVGNINKYVTCDLLFVTN